MDWPFISISISTFNRLPLLQRLIKSLGEHNTYPKDRYKIILVDDSTNDDTLEYLKQKDTHDIHSPDRGCIPCGCGIAPYVFQIENLPVAIQYYQLGGQGDAICKNKGLQMANQWSDKETEFYWHLDDDVYLTKPGLLQYGIKIMRAFPEIGILSFHTHRLPEAPHIMQKHHLPYATEERDGLLVWYKNFSSCSDWFMRKSMVDEIGLFDENIKQGVELRKKNLDTLYIERIKAVGNKWKVASIPDCGVIHADMRELGYGPTY